MPIRYCITDFWECFDKYFLEGWLIWDMPVAPVFPKKNLSISIMFLKQSAITRGNSTFPCLANFYVFCMYQVKISVITHEKTATFPVSAILPVSCCPTLFANKKKKNQSKGEYVFVSKVYVSKEVCNYKRKKGNVPCRGNLSCFLLPNFCSSSGRSGLEMEPPHMCWQIKRRRLPAKAS